MTTREQAIGKTLEQIDALKIDWDSYYPIMENQDGQLICTGIVNGHYPDEFNDGNWSICGDDAYAMADEADTKVCGKTIQIDLSGVGHCWRAIARDDIPSSVIEDIEAEIIDGKRDSCADFVASNGLHYRWS